MLVGIDVGGTNLVAAKVTESGQIVEKASIPVGHSSTEDRLCARIIELAHLVASDDKSIRAVGIGFPGLVDNHSGFVIKTPNLPFGNTPFRKIFQKSWDVPVFMGNDANCAAIGEYWAGAARDCESALVITLGTGIGGGFIHREKLFLGAYSGALEVGHMIVHPGGLSCGCGSKGCFEQYASATALIRMAQAAMERNRNSLLWELSNENDGRLDGRIVFQAAKMNDFTAQQVVDQYTSNLALGLSNLINILQPEVTCLGGGISSADESLLLNPVREKVRNYLFDKAAPIRIERAALNNDAGVIGAALLCKTI